jgi:hypothetical protein
VTAGQYIDIPGIARTVLAGVIAHFAASPVELPGRRLIAPGDTRAVAWDCECVIVTCGGIVWGQGPGAATGVARGTGNPVSVGARYTVMAVQIVRSTAAVEHDGIDPPPPADLTTAALALLTDGGLLSQALVELCGKDGALQRMGMASAGDVVFLGPAGMFAATEGHLSVTASRLKGG